VFGDLSRSRVLVIGAGEMAELSVQHLLTAGVSQIDVINRTYERGVELAFQLGARAHRFEDLTGRLLLADIVISSTGSSEPVLTRRLLSSVMRQRKQRPLFIVDIAVPPDVDAEAGDLANIYLFNVDDLEQVVAENLKERRREARVAERLIREEVEHFLDWVRKQDAVPVIKDLRRHFTDIALAEAEKTAAALHLGGSEDREKLDAMARAIVNKLLHHPTQELKDQAARPDGSLLARSTRRLFKLPRRSASEETADLPATETLREETE
jgi:glutamyl-tRNA reductase